MAILPILTAPDRRLKQKSLPVEQVDDRIRTLLDDMAETMYAASGIGLAAPQVGVLKRIIVVDVTYFQERNEKKPIFLINPEIIEREGTLMWEEGCLSVPEHTAEVERSSHIRVQGLDRHGERIIIAADELLAVCLQHEIDHLSGMLFIDHISRLKRTIILQKLKKRKKQEQ